MIGTTLKKIRKAKNIPIKNLCHEAIDQGNYWRLENEKIESSFSTILKIIYNMNITIEEFVEQLPIERVKYEDYESKLIHYFKNKDIDMLEHLKEDLHQELPVNASLRISHLYYLTDLYISRIKNVPYKKDSQKFLQKYLINCNDWGSYELSLLNNTLFIFDVDISFLFYKKCVAKFSKSKNKESLKIIPLTLNLMALSAEYNQRKIILFLLSILEKLEIQENDTYEYIIRKWGINIANYLLFKEDTHLNEAKKIVNLLSALDMKDTHALYSSWTLSYENLVAEQKL